MHVVQEFILLQLQALDVPVLSQDDVMQFLHSVLDIHEFELERLDSGVDCRIGLGWIVTHVCSYWG